MVVLASANDRQIRYMMNEWDMRLIWFIVLVLQITHTARCQEDMLDLVSLSGGASLATGDMGEGTSSFPLLVLMSWT